MQQTLRRLGGSRKYLPQWSFHTPRWGNYGAALASVTSDAASTKSSG